MAGMTIRIAVKQQCWLAFNIQRAAGADKTFRLPATSADGQRVRA